MDKDTVTLMYEIAFIIWVGYDIIYRKHKSNINTTDIVYKEKRKKGVIFYLAIIMLILNAISSIVYSHIGTNQIQSFVTALCISVSVVAIWEHL